MNLQEDIPLAPLTTLQVGGVARYFVEATTEAEVREAVDWAGLREYPMFVLGGGSNLVVSDAGWPGLVLKVGIVGIEEHIQQDRVRFNVGAGEDWDHFVAHAVARNCAGVECMSGIPGSVGGTPVQNVGAYGQEAGDTICRVLALDVEDMQTREMAAEDCGFSYRTSIFNSTHRGRYIILRVAYELTMGGSPSIRYADLQRYFAGWAQPPSLVQVRDAVRTIRAGKAMLITAGDEDCRSAGSFFKNPVLSESEYQNLVAEAATRGLQIPSYPMVSSQKKVSAAWLVEHSGFAKGFNLGRVGISRKHALAIVNRGGATAAEVVALKDEIQKRVQETWGVTLQTEPVFVGF